MSTETPSPANPEPSPAGQRGSLSVIAGSALYDYLDWLLYPDGTCTHKGRAVAWYKDQRTGKPWIPSKRKTFVSLVKGMERDGDISYLPNTTVSHERSELAGPTG